MYKEKVLISGCLLGVSCRMDAKSKPLPSQAIEELEKVFHLIPVCPEILGGLSTPRNPSERKGDLVISCSGVDVTAEYKKGAEETLRLANIFDCGIAILKEKSPSCGHGLIYDGNFQKKLISGDGVTSELLIQNGITIYGESQIPALLEKSKTGHKREIVENMNMCMVCDDDKVLALNKVGKNYSGITFPGGHVEPGETFYHAVIREVYEETGLTIKNPVLKGVYHWYRDGIHNIGYIYRADQFDGTLKSSEEGKVYWISRSEYEKLDLAVGMDRVLNLIDSSELTECFMDIKDDGSIEEHMFGMDNSDI